MAQRKILSREDSLKKIMEKKEFRTLPLRDVKLVYSLFDKADFLEEEKVKKTRELLRKVYSAFSSRKLLGFKEKSFNWFLNKHISSKERLPFYEELYSRIFKDFKTEKLVNVYDLGSGVNGFSYPFFKKVGLKIKYFGVEAIGFLVDSQKEYFKIEKNFQVFHESLFDFEKIKKIISLGKGKKVIFLFKVIDSLEMLKRDYSKEFLKGVVPLVDLVVVSFATKSLIKKKRFFVNRSWIKNFIRENFNFIEEFELGAEEYLIFSKKDL